MKRSKSKPKSAPKRVLRLPDLDHTKLSVLNTLGSPQSQRAYGIAIDDFIAWYCSEPRIAFNKTVVLRYRIQLEAKHLAPATINLRLAAVRRLAYEAADVGLLSPDLAAGIRRVKGAKRLGVRLGNWLSAEQAKDLLRSPNGEALIGKRDHAILALLLGVRAAALGNRSAYFGTFPAPGRSLGHHGSVRQGRPYSIHSRSGLGEECRRSLDCGGSNRIRLPISLRDKVRNGMGRKDHREGDLARRSQIRHVHSPWEDCAS